MQSTGAARPLVAHVIHKMALGGLEKGLITLINRLGQYRHAIIAMTTIDYDFARGIEAPGTDLIALNKKAGQDPGVYVKLWRMLRRMQPHIVHSRNIGALEAQCAAFAARVPVRIHGEHGRDMHDLDGKNARYRLVRRAMSPFVQEYIALSADLAGWLTESIGIRTRRVHQIYNGVNNARFFPSAGSNRRRGLDSGGVIDESSFVIGSVGRMQAVKDHLSLVEAFVSLVRSRPEWRSKLRLMIVGDGPLRALCAKRLQSAGVSDLAWLPGERTDVPELMRAMDVFALPSLAEGISNTVLEAMATGIPVVATRVGGNAELVEDGRNGTIVPVSDIPALASALARYVENPELTAAEGKAARQRVDAHFSVEAMVNAYASVYDSALARAGLRF